MQHIEDMARGTIESGLAAPAQLIETDRGNRPDQSKTGGNRDYHWQEPQRIARGQADQQNSKQRIDHAQEYSVAGERGEIVVATGKRVIEIGCRDAANDRLQGICARPDKDVRIGHSAPPVAPRELLRSRHGPCQRAARAYYRSKIGFLDGYFRTNHASRATIMALHPCGCFSECEGSRQGSLHIPVCANRLRFYAAAVVNDASRELVHGIPFRAASRLHTAVSFDQRYVREDQLGTESSMLPMSALGQKQTLKSFP